jgi:DegV family protein with EDD domain
LQIVREVAKLYKGGATIDEILAWAKEEVDKFAIYFYADNLKFFKRSGRVSGISAVMGDLLDIKPIIHINNEGQMVSLSKSRGRKATLKKIVEMVSNSQENMADYKVLVAHADAIEIANMAVDMLKDRFGDDLDIEIIPVNPTIGGHCGPDAVGISFHAKGREVD